MRESIRRAKSEFAKPHNLARLEKYHGERAEWVVRSWTDTWLSPDFADWNLGQALSRIKSPVLAIHGDLDEYGSADHAKQIALGRGYAEILHGIRHFPHRENEQHVIDIVQQFLAGGS